MEPTPTPVDDGETLIVRARTLMRTGLTDCELTLSDIAGQLYVSPRQLQRAFAEVGSAGFRNELAGMRVREAARLILRNPHRSVAAVAAAVGYRHPPFFAKTFREVLGKSPGAWRQECLARTHEATRERKAAAKRELAESRAA